MATLKSLGEQMFSAFYFLVLYFYNMTYVRNNAIYCFEDRNKINEIESNPGDAVYCKIETTNKASAFKPNVKNI